MSNRLRILSQYESKIIYPQLAAVIKTSKIKLLTLQNCGLSCKEVIEFLEALGKCTVEVVDVRMNEYIQKNPQLIQQNVDRFNYLTISL
jgi:hypothetical protein